MTAPAASTEAPCRDWDSSRRRCLRGHPFPTHCAAPCQDHQPLPTYSHCLATLWQQLTRPGA